MVFLIAIIVSALALGTIIVLHERYGFLAVDRFPNATSKVVAYAWLGVLFFVMSGLVIASSRSPVRTIEPDQVSFWSLFLLHVILVIFLAGWWTLSGRPPIRSFLNWQPADGSRAAAVGLAVGVGGWALTIGAALTIALILSAFDLIPKDLKPSPMIPWMATLPMWKKGVIVLMAMTVEEAFFRGFLQKRIGLVASTILFALAHAGYGQPFMLIGVTIISIVIGATFYWTKDLRPCIVAHGVFDAIQLFVIVPLVLKLMPAS